MRDCLAKPRVSDHIVTEKEINKNNENSTKDDRRVKKAKSNNESRLKVSLAQPLHSDVSVQLQLDVPRPVISSRYTVSQLQSS